MKSFSYHLYRAKYRFSKYLNLTVPVDVSLELASKCNMACSYCLSPDTPVLTLNSGWRPIGELEAGEQIVSFDEYSPDVDMANRKMNIAVIEKKWSTKKKAIRITTKDGEIVCSGDHKFLDQSSRWKEAKNIKVGQVIKFAADTWRQNIDSVDYKAGYLAGVTDGDATAKWHKSESSRAVYWRLALVDMEPLERVLGYFNEMNISCPGLKPFQKSDPDYQDLNKIEIRSRDALDTLKLVIDSAHKESINYKIGYLAGIFDTEGSYSECIRISQVTNNGVRENVMSYLNELGFDSVMEERGVRLSGDVWTKIKFMSLVNPAIKRKISHWEGSGVRHRSSEVTEIQELGEMELVDIQTSSKTFYASGFPTHNCYHADPQNLPFERGIMPLGIAISIIDQCAELGVNSLKMNWKGESTLNPYFERITERAKLLASGSTFIDRLTNSNFKFNTDRDDIFRGLANQTKVKVSYDSFRKEVFETQRTLGNHDTTTRNIDKFYNWPGRKTELVIQAVRTKLNADEDIASEAKRRWPEAEISIRDMVAGRVNKDVTDLEHRTRDFSERQSCIQAHARIIFNHEGKAFPCCPDIGEKLKIGDIREQDIYEIFNSREAHELRQSLLNKSAFKSDPCKNCSSFETYKGFKPSWNS